MRENHYPRSKIESETLPNFSSFEAYFYFFLLLLIELLFDVLAKLCLSVYNETRVSVSRHVQVFSTNIFACTTSEFFHV